MPSAKAPASGAEKSSSNTRKKSETAKSKPSATEREQQHHSGQPSASDSQLSAAQKSIQSVLQTAFDEAQKGFASHDKHIRNIHRCLKRFETQQPSGTKSPLQEYFQAEFVGLVNHILLVFKREPAVERLVEFVAKCATRTAASLDAAPSATAAPASEASEAAPHGNPLAVFLIEYLLHFHSAKDKAVRFRVCQFVSKILDYLGEDAEIDDALWDRIYSSMLERAKDKIPIVRVQAIQAISRLQDPSDAECPVISQYIRLLSSDSSPDVRRAALGQIALSKLTLPHILSRTRDVKDVVRRHAFVVLAEKVHIKALSVADRVRLLREGLGDRSTVVRDACGELICKSWLKGTGNSIPALLSYLSVKDNASVAESAVRFILSENASAVNLDTLTYKDFLSSELNAATALYWRILVEHLVQQASASARGAAAIAEERMERLVPEVSSICSIIRRHVELQSAPSLRGKQEQSQEAEFVTLQLLHMARCLDLSDEVGRRNLLALAREMLISFATPVHFLAPLMKLVACLEQQVSSRFAFILQLLEEIHPFQQSRDVAFDSDSEDEADAVEKPAAVEVDPVLAKLSERERNLKLASIKVQLMELSDKKDELVKREKFEDAVIVRTQMEELKKQQAMLAQLTKDSVAQPEQIAQAPRQQQQQQQAGSSEPWARALTIVATLLEDASMCELYSRKRHLHLFCTLLNKLVLPAIQSQHLPVRALAMRSLGLLCLLDRDLAQAHASIFMTAIDIDDATVIVYAVQALLDLYLLFGSALFEASRSIAQAENAASDVFGTNEGPGAQTEEPKDDRVLSVLLRLVHSTDTVESVRRTAYEGLAKLLLADRIQSETVLGTLLVAYFDESTEKDTYLRQCLSVFFPAFAFSRPQHQELIAKAFVPSVAMIASALSINSASSQSFFASSTVAKIDIAKIAKFTSFLCQPAGARRAARFPEASSALTAQDQICVAVLHKVAQLVRSKEQQRENEDLVRLLIKSLAGLQIASSDQRAVDEIAQLCTSALKALSHDKLSVKLLSKFKQGLEAGALVAQAPRARASASRDGDGDGEDGEDEDNGSEAENGNCSDDDDKDDKDDKEDSDDDDDDDDEDDDGSDSGNDERLESNVAGTSRRSEIDEAQLAENDENASNNDEPAGEITTSMRAEAVKTTKTRGKTAVAAEAKPARSAKSAPRQKPVATADASTTGVARPRRAAQRKNYAEADA